MLSIQLEPSDRVVVPQGKDRLEFTPLVQMVARRDEHIRQLAPYIAVEAIHAVSGDDYWRITLATGHVLVADATDALVHLVPDTSDGDGVHVHEEIREENADNEKERSARSTVRMERECNRLARLSSAKVRRRTPRPLFWKLYDIRHKRDGMRLFQLFARSGGQYFRGENGRWYPVPFYMLRSSLPADYYRQQGWMLVRNWTTPEDAKRDACTWMTTAAYDELHAEQEEVTISVV